MRATCWTIGTILLTAGCTAEPNASQTGSSGAQAVQGGSTSAGQAGATQSAPNTAGSTASSGTAAGRGGTAATAMAGTPAANGGAGAAAQAGANAGGAPAAAGSMATPMGGSGQAGMAAVAGSSGMSGAAGSSGATDERCPVVVADADCDKSQRPFVFVHGTYGSGDNITHVADLFGSNGFCQDRFVGVEYNSVLFLGNDPSPLIDAVVDEVRKATGQDKVDIACHSQGTFQCTGYMGDATRAAKIAHYINLSGGVSVPNNVQALSLSSDNDLGGMPQHATNVMNRVTFKDMDHMGVAASTEAFVEMWKYLHDGQEPKYKTVQCGEDPITIESMVETFADNQPISGAKVQAFEITGTAREQGTAAAMQMSDAKGRVPAFQLKRNVQYELQATDSAGKVISRIYFTPFKRSNRLVRFLAPSGDANTLMSSTGKVTTGAGFSAISARYLGGSFRHDFKEVLTAGGTDALTDMTAGRTMVTVGLFMSDQNKNGKSDYGQSFSSNFLIGTDVFFDASQPAFIELSWKDPFGIETKIKVPNWPSTDGIMSVMLP